MEFVENDALEITVKNENNLAQTKLCVFPENTLSQIVEVCGDLIGLDSMQRAFYKLNKTVKELKIANGDTFVFAGSKEWFLVRLAESIQSNDLRKFWQ